jgi:nucleotide-binding universal stress UspA family protein
VNGILAAIDFSGGTREVQSTAVELARAFDCALWLLHVAAPEPDFIGYDPGPQTVRDQRAEELRAEHRRLQQEADALRERGIEATALLIQGPTVEKILAEAERLEVDVVVIGSHGHGALRRALLGSVSEGVVRGARCRVMIVPSRG